MYYSSALVLLFNTGIQNKPCAAYCCKQLNTCIVFAFICCHKGGTLNRAWQVKPNMISAAGYKKTAQKTIVILPYLPG
jgi:hypothetical protein